MKSLKLAILVCVCVLVPTAARAQDDWEWLEWLEKLSGPRLYGAGTNVHLLCLNDEPRAVPCAVWSKGLDFDRIKHEIDFHFAFLLNRGARFSDPAGATDSRSLQVLKLMGFYHYHFGRWFEFGAGAGYMPFFGEGFEKFSRGIVTPLSFILAPPGEPGVLKGFTLRIEKNYITQGLNGANFGNLLTTFATNGEWKWSVAAGYDLRRVLQKK